MIKNYNGLLVKLAFYSEFKMQCSIKKTIINYQTGFLSLLTIGTVKVNLDHFALSTLSTCLSDGTPHVAGGVLRQSNCLTCKTVLIVFICE